MLDYLSFTIEKQTALGFHDTYDLIPIKGRNGYLNGLENGLGGRVYYGGKNRGYHFVYSGAALTAMRKAGLSDRELLGHSHDEGANFRRLDIALDYEISPSVIEEIYSQFVLNDKRRNKTAIQNEGDIKTVYIGSLKNRKTLLRCYDKGYQKALEGVNWVRLEGEFHTTANRVSAALIDGITPQSIMARYFGEKSARFDEMINSAPAIMRHEDKEKDTRQWLLTVAIKSLGRYFASIKDEGELQDELSLFSKQLTSAALMKMSIATGDCSG